MKRILTLLLPLGLAATVAFAQKKQTSTSVRPTSVGPTSGLQPLIDRELLFGNPEISGAQISPDGKYIAFQKPWKDTRNIWVKKTEEPFSAARLLTTETKRPIPTFLWTRDGKYIVYAKDNDGDENFNVYAIDPAAPTPAGADA